MAMKILKDGMVRFETELLSGGSGKALVPAAAPGVAASGTGSTVAVGTYYVVVTYTDGVNEGPPSPQSSVTTTSGQNIVVTSPAAQTGATKYNVYIGTASGGPYYLQNNTALTLAAELAAGVGSISYATNIGTNFTQSVAVVSVGLQPPTTCLENFALRLWTGSHTPSITDTLSTYTALEATFTGYAPIILTRSLSGTTWATPTLQTGTNVTIDPTNGNAKALYGAAAQSWNATSAQTVNGYFWSGTASGKGLIAEQINGSTGVSLVNPSTLQIQPELEIGTVTDS